MAESEALFREVVQLFLKKHGKELKRLVKGDMLLEAGLRRLEQIAGFEAGGGDGKKAEKQPV